MFSYRGHFLTGSSQVQNIMVEVKSQGEDGIPHKDDAAGASHHVEDVVPHHILYVDTECSDVCVVCGDKASGE